MSIFEFDEEKEWKLFGEAEYQYGVEEGIERGRKLERKNYLVQNICKKLRKGKDIATIAVELEEEENTIRKICDTAKQYAPEYNEKEIFDAIEINTL